MIAFELAGILTLLIVPVIQNAQVLDKSIYFLGSYNFVVCYGVVMAIEAGYQVMYMIYQRFMGEAGAGAESFRYSDGIGLLSQGNAQFNRALSSAEYYGTGGPLKDAYNKVESYKDY
jgi:hypothetical protein